MIGRAFVLALFLIPSDLLAVAQSHKDSEISAQLSDAERIAQLQRAIADGQTQVRKLKTRLDDPNSEYALAEKAFTELDDQFTASKKLADKLRAEGKTQEADATEASLNELENKRQLARERFDLAIEERKAMQQQLSTLEEKIATDQTMLARLTAPPPKKNQDASEQPEAVSSEAPKATGKSPDNKALKPDAKTKSAPSAESGVGAEEKKNQPLLEEEANQELVEAKQEATSKKQAATLAKADARSLADRSKQTDEDIALERKLLSTARQKVSNIERSRDALRAELRKRMADGASWSELADLRQQIADGTKRLSDARKQIQRHRDRIDSLQSERADLQSQQLAAVTAVKKKQAEAEAAQKQVERLENPLSPQNIIKWLVAHGPRVLLTLLGMIVILGGARIFERRFVTWVAMTARGGTLEDRENRARTLVSVLHNAVRVVVIGGGLLMIVNEFGVNIIPLLGGAAVLGLAAAFGAQNLVRDYFYGFIILLENQYTVNDVIEIGGTSGLVERITLRITVLRDLQGTVHFIPHGTIDKVSNMTHGWSRALFSVGVAYKEDVDRVMDVLVSLGRELRHDPKFADMILDDPEMLGVDSFGESEVVIKFFIKTRTLKQWAVKRELQRRIKYKFDELGIEIPYPHRTIYHHYSGSAIPGP